MTKIIAPAMSTEVLNMQPAIMQNKHIRAGRDSVVANRDTYITKLDGQSTDSFEAMVKMAPVYILYPKVVDGFTGTVFAKSPNLTGVTLSDEEKVQLTNIDMMGNSIDKLSEKVVTSVLEDGFCATFNDYSKKQKRSFIRFVEPTQFVSFRVSAPNGFPEISQFIYKEEIQVNNEGNEFDYDIKTEYTVLDMYEEKYRVRVFRTVNTQETNTGDEEEVVQIGIDVFPTKNSNHFKSIPIQLHGIDASNFTLKRSPLQDISDMNISVIQRVIDQVYMLHWTALPTPWTTGVTEKEAPDTIGPTKIWALSNPEAKVGMLEFSGQSAQAHEKFIEKLIDIMAAIGAQILKKEGISRETATSVLVRSASQTALISTLIKNVSWQIAITLGIYLDWEKIKKDSEYNYVLNDDFIRVDMEPNAQIALVKSWLDGAISYKTMFDKMKEGEIINTNKTLEEELKDILENPPPFFLETLQGEINERLAKNAAEAASKLKKDEMKGSNLENDNIPNKQATEQV